MLIEIIKSKIHRVKVTDADLSYVGSISIDSDLIDAANFVVGEKVHVVNLNNGERLETYIIEGKRGSGEITLNGPAARKAQKGDIIIVIGYAQMEFEEAKKLFLKTIEINPKSSFAYFCLSKLKDINKNENFKESLLHMLNHYNTKIKGIIKENNIGEFKINIRFFFFPMILILLLINNAPPEPQ